MKKISLLLFLCSFLVAFYACNDHYHRNQAYADVPLANIKRGEALAKKYCGTCHMLPDPSQVSAQSWEEGVLPNMGPRLGIFEYNFVRYPSGKADPNLDSSVYPSHPVVSAKEWQYILDYYTATAPDSLPEQSREQKLQMGLPLFEVRTPAPKPDFPVLSFLRIDTTLYKNSLLAFDLQAQTLFRYNKALTQVDSVKVDGCIVEAVVQNGRWLTCNIGNINPNNAKLGTAQYLNTTAAGRFQPFSSAEFQNLARPVDITPADINGDGRTDYVVCEFGFVTGSLSWFEQTAGGSFQRRVIQALPGAAKSYVQDHNRDGLPDLWVLFAQGEEGIYLFTNQGNGQFRQERILRFPPSFGSTFFEMVDMNGDDLQDIVYTCGDNADYSQTLKPYHGVYVFQNKGQNRFEQTKFFPINGCFKALARDYDNDGDMDIAAISYFADYVRQPEEGFVYLENEGGLKFRPFTIPESRLGRWLTLDAADLDGDQKIDLVLGNFAAGPSFLPSAVDWRKGPAFLFLRNRRKE